jgi:hypothetical protein
MHKLSIVAAAITAAISLAPIPVITAVAHAQVGILRVPNNPNYPTRSTYNCTTELGFLRRVYEEQLDQIEDPNRVWVTPVCMGEDYGIMRSDGNAGALRKHIAQNKAIVKALFAKRFGPEDVVGIRMMGPDAGTFYVHPFHNE